MSTIIILNSPINYKANADKEYSAQSIAVMDVDSGRVLFEKDLNEKRYMASTTKILTAITVIENCDVNSSFKITKNCVGIEGSSIYLEEGEILTIKDLLYGLMLRSGNDCAVSLAYACCGNYNSFVELMNRTAKKIGAKNSNFTNPHGLHDDNHFTTAYDLALITCYAMKNDTFKEIVSTKSVKIPYTTRDTVRLLLNKNKMLKSLDGCTGVKTGYTKKAGRCLVTSCERNGLHLVSVVLNCGPMWEESSFLLNNAFSTYTKYCLVNKDDIVDFIPTDSNDKCPVGVTDNVVLPLTETEYRSLNIKYDLANLIQKGTKKGTPVGEIKVYIENNLIFTEKIYTIVDV